MTEPAQDLIAVERNTALQAFSSDKGLEPILAEARQAVAGFEHDMSTGVGRKRTASLAMKVRKLKTRLDDMGKDLTTEWAKKKKAVDDNRRAMRTALDDLAQEARRPLDEYEAAEDRRIEAHTAEIRRIVGYRNIEDDVSSTDIQAMIDRLTAIQVDESFEEYEAEAHREKTASLDYLSGRLDRQAKHEAEQAELARLRAEAEAREQKEAEERAAREAKEREERIAREAAEAAKREAEKEQARIEAEREAAVQRAQEAQEHAKEQERLRMEAEARSKVEAEQAAARATLEEQQRQEREETQRADEKAAREADLEHRKTYNREAHAALMEEGLSHDVALTVIRAIIDGSIPHVTISY